MFWFFIVLFAIILYAIATLVSKWYLRLLAKVKPNHCETIKDINDSKRIGWGVIALIVSIPLLFVGYYLFGFMKIIFYDSGVLARFFSDFNHLSTLLMK